MKITKYNQSCLLIETNNKRILIDPGVIGYNEDILNEWNNIDYIFVTHRHDDHCNKEAINKIVDKYNAKVFTTNEVLEHVELKNATVVKKDDIIELDGIKVEVTKALHGFLTKMKYNGGEIKENVGYIIDDSRTRLYHTSDSINFNQDYKCDVLCMPFNGNGLTFGLIDGPTFAKDINPKIVLPIHLEHATPVMNPSKESLSEALKSQDLNYKILDLKESIEV